MTPNVMTPLSKRSWNTYVSLTLCSFVSHSNALSCDNAEAHCFVLLFRQNHNREDTVHGVVARDTG